MNVLYSLLLIILAVGSVSLQVYFLIQKKEFKIFFVHTGILILAIGGGIIGIYEMDLPSIAKIVGRMFPWTN
jgi:hypothetical protein